MSAFSKKNMIFCPLFPRKYAAKVQQKMHIRKSGEKYLQKMIDLSISDGIQYSFKLA